MAQVAEHLPSQHQALSSKPIPPKKKRATVMKNKYKQMLQENKEKQTKFFLKL
jgi:hypothetical protein